MFRLPVCLIATGCLWISVCSPSGPSGLVNKGTFSLIAKDAAHTPADGQAGFNILDGWETAVSTGTQADVRFYYYSPDSQAVIIGGGVTGGGIWQEEGSRAPSSGYFTSLRMSLHAYPYPIQFFVLTRDNLHYCQVFLDSVVTGSTVTAAPADTVHTCTGYFRYIMNLEEGERDFE